jgi:hypothetical protein
VSLAQVQSPASMIMVLDGRNSFCISSTNNMTNLRGNACLGLQNANQDRADRHNDIANVDFIDGHVKSHKRDFLTTVNVTAELHPWGFTIVP